MRGAPSISRRVVWGFVLAYSLVLAGAFTLLVIAWDSVADPYKGSGALVDQVIQSARVDRNGRIRLESTAELRRLARGPRPWFIAATEAHVIRVGFPPPEAERLFAGAPLKSWMEAAAEIPVTGSDGVPDYMSVESWPFSASPLVVLGGGVDQDRAGAGSLLSASLRIGIPWVVLGLVVMGIGALVVVVPLVLRTVRPLSRSAMALNVDDPSARLSEAGVARELAPVVHAFNAVLDRLEQSYIRRRRFMADVAHELRTPLAVLTVRSEALDDGAAKDDLQRGLHRLADLVGQMLDAERLRGAASQAVVVDLTTVACRSVTEIAPLAVRSGYQIELDAPPRPVTVLGDGQAIERALGNLLGNAVAHGGNGGLISVRVRSPAVIEVADQGPGIKPEIRDQVFEPFFRERWDRDGCGLGLHFVRETVEAHGGQAEAVATSSGACFRLTFPPPLRRSDDGN